MFEIVSERKRRLWSARTVAASVAVNALLAAALMAAIRTPNPPVEEDTRLVEWPIDDMRQDPRPQEPQPEKPQPMSGQTVELPALETVPDTIRQQDPHLRPLLEEHVTGVGQLGAVYGLPNRNPVVPVENTEPPLEERLPVFFAPIPADSADTKPELANRRQAEMILQRSYPPLLRHAGAVGRTTVALIIDRDGKVEPGSVQVQETTHEDFKDAAVRSVEQFRFRPAVLNGEPVAVLVTMPITWRLEN